MKAISIILFISFILFILLIILFIWSCLIIAHRSDEWSDEDERDN